MPFVNSRKNNHGSVYNRETRHVPKRMEKTQKDQHVIGRMRFSGTWKNLRTHEENIMDPLSSEKWRKYKKRRRIDRTRMPCRKM